MIAGPEDPAGAPPWPVAVAHPRDGVLVSRLSEGPSVVVQKLLEMPECPCDVGSLLDRLLPCTQSASCMYGAGPVLVTGGLSLVAYAASVDYRYLARAAEGAGSAGSRATVAGRSREWWTHAGISGFLIGNVLYNYIRCVSTNPGDTDSDEYKELVQQAKAAKLIPKRGYESRAGWMDRDAYEWTYCSHTGKEKPPRAHYDHITEKLVLNMDHYCPWMFNVVGYRNYHYFWRTLFYLSMYATRTTAATFKLLASKAQRQHAGADGVESVLMLQSIGIGATVAVVPLFSWHCYLMGSAQTTIEYFGNGGEQPRSGRQRAALRAGTPMPRSAYSQGLWLNWVAVFGDGNPIFALLPSFSDSVRPSPPYPEDLKDEEEAA